MKLIFAGSHDIAQRYVFQHRIKEDFRYISELQQMRGITDTDILLLSGWDLLHSKSLITELKCLLLYGCRIVGDNRYIPYSVWSELKMLESYMKRNGDKKPEEILSRFDLLII